jgi:hypothetical protein
MKVLYAISPEAWLALGWMGGWYHIVGDGRVPHACRNGRGEDFARELHAVKLGASFLDVYAA